MKSTVLTVSAALLGLAVASGGLRAAEGGTGDVRISFGFAEGTMITGGRLTFAAKDGTAHAWDAGKGNTAKLPAGEYQLRAGQLSLSDADGATWQVQLAGSKAFKVPADGTVLLKLGGPFKVEPVTAGKAVPGGTLAVTHKLLGASDEGYSVLYKTAPTRGMPTAPAVAVEDAEGGQVAKGSMEYG